MAARDIVLAGVTLLAAGLFFQPSVLKSRRWRATVTPLASIIGSGFLVAGPMLAHVAGRWAWVGMLALCLLGYLYGTVIRHNIAAIEPQLGGGDTPRHVTWLEGASHLALAFAYFISVGYYLVLFAAFGLRLGEVTTTFWIKGGATAAIGLIGVVGAFGGLRALERMEVLAVGVKLAVIAGLFGALLLANGEALTGGGPLWTALPHDEPRDGVLVLMGLLILVQGFETSRYLGDEYDAEVRIRTMRHAQWISSGIYVAFILLVTHFFGDGGLKADGGETAVIDLLRPLGVLVGPLLILAALASQFSAAVADTNGAAGLVAETSKGRVPVRWGNVATALAAAAVVWAGDIYEIINWASKAFVIYYGLQSIQAAMSAWGAGKTGRSALFSAAVLLAIAIVILAKPAGV